jgi:hypothetical protein
MVQNHVHKKKGLLPHSQLSAGHPKKKKRAAGMGYSMLVKPVAYII